MNFLIPIGAGSLVCLMPLALYFLFLAHLNYRRRPTMLNGRWDFTFMLLGLSGFLLIGGPVLLSAIDAAWRSFWFEGDFRRLQEVWQSDRYIWPITAFGYVVLLIALIAHGLYWRGAATVVYNLRPVMLEEILVKALDLSELNWRKALGGIEIGIRNKERATIDDGDQQELKPDPNRSFKRAGFVQIESFPAFFNATLKWHKTDPLLRKEVEVRLQQLLHATESPSSPVGGWALTTAVAIFVTMLLWMGYLIWTVLGHQKMV